MKSSPGIYEYFLDSNTHT